MALELLIVKNYFSFCYIHELTIHNGISTGFILMAEILQLVYMLQLIFPMSTIKVFSNFDKLDGLIVCIWGLKMNICY